MELYCRRREFVEKTIYLASESLTTTTSHTHFPNGMWCGTVKLKTGCPAQGNKDVRPFDIFEKNQRDLHISPGTYWAIGAAESLWNSSTQSHTFPSNRKPSITIKNVLKTDWNACCDQSSGSPNRGEWKRNRFKEGHLIGSCSSLSWWFRQSEGKCIFGRRFACINHRNITRNPWVDRSYHRAMTEYAKTFEKKLHIYFKCRFLWAGWSTFVDANADCAFCAIIIVIIVEAFKMHEKKTPPLYQKVKLEVPCVHHTV